MQKKLIALAIAGLASSAAFAQSNVTLYGKIDMSYEHASGNGMKTSGINSGGHDGSRIGFKGEEALGSGMKAIFGLEYQLRTDVNGGIGNTGGYNSRETFVGLSGDFGTVKAGNIYSSGANWTGKFDSLDAANSYSPLQYFEYAVGATINTSGTLNSVGYESKSMGGFTLRAVYGRAPFSGDNTAYTNDQESLMGFGLDYDRGPLSVGVVHHRISDGGNVANVDQNETAFGASYNFGPAALYGTYQTLAADLGGADIARFRIGSVGVTVPVGTPGLIRLMYSRLDNKLAGATANDAKSWGALYEHDMSKRTKAYVGYNHMSNDGLAAFVTPAGQGSSGSGAAALGAAGNTSSGYGFGVIHKF